MDDNLTEWLGRAQFISMLNLRKGYWQVALALNAKPKTTFSMTCRHWQYRILLFSLHGAHDIPEVNRYHATAPSHLRHCLPGGHRGPLIHLCQPPIAPKGGTEYTQEGWAHCKPPQVNFRLTKTQYLGCRIGWGLLKPQEKKIESVHGDPSQHQNARYMPFWG